MKVARLVLSLTLALFAFQASGAFELVADVECRERCVDDDARGRCADSCTECSCCFHPRPMARASVTEAPAPACRTCPPAEPTPEYASAPPSEILHVPISLA
ncbi:MAG TPA: hypothetical protein VIS07_16525 [Candidatus Binatia bacterium]